MLQLTWQEYSALHLSPNRAALAASMSQGEGQYRTASGAVAVIDRVGSSIHSLLTADANSIGLQNRRQLA